VPTLLAAHETPPEHCADRAAGARDLHRDRARGRGRGLARFCDVFCERGVFSADESRTILEAGRRHGLLPRLHADEFADSGGAELAAELGALSADHLMAVSDAGIEALAKARVTALLLPAPRSSCAEGLRAGAAARRGVPVFPPTATRALHQSPTIAQLAVIELGSDRGDATATTLNAAVTLGLGSEIGTLEAGKRADIVVLDAPNLLHLAYHYGVNPVRSVVKAGREVFRAGNLAGDGGSRIPDDPLGARR
jgi:imidazolonepropionase